MSNIPKPEELIKQIKDLKITKCKNGNEAISLVLHLIMLSQGFRCVGTSEKSIIKEGEVLPQGWNQSDDVYSFKYKHKQSSMTFVLKCLVLGNNLLVNGIALEDKHPYSISIE